MLLILQNNHLHFFVIISILTTLYNNSYRRIHINDHFLKPKDKNVLRQIYNGVGFVTNINKVKYDTVIVVTIYPRYSPKHVWWPKIKNAGKIMFLTHNYDLFPNLNKILALPKCHLICLHPNAASVAQRRYTRSHLFIPLTHDRKPMPWFNILTFIVPGALHSYRRNYYSLISALEKYPEMDIKIIIMGFSGHSDKDVYNKLSLDKRVAFMLDLHENAFNQVIQRGHFLLPLVDETFKHDYFNKKLTGTICLSLSFNVPMIIHKDLAKHYKMNDILPTYQSEPDFIDNVFPNVVENFSLDNYYIMKEKLEKNRDHWISINRKTLK